MRAIGSLALGERNTKGAALTHKVAHLAIAVLLRNLVQRPQLLRQDRAVAGRGGGAWGQAQGRLDEQRAGGQQAGECMH